MGPSLDLLIWQLLVSNRYIANLHKMKVSDPIALKQAERERATLINLVQQIEKATK